MQIFAFGDSITHGFWDLKGGWVSRLRAELDKAQAGRGNVYFSVYELGVPGDTTRDLLGRFDAELKARIVDADKGEQIRVLFSIGTNDAASRKEGEKQVPLLEFEANIDVLAEKALRTTNKVTFISTFPIDEARTTPCQWSGKYCANANFMEYNNAIKKMCKARNLLFIDIYGKLIKKNYRELLEDGLHPNSKGHQRIYKLVSRALRKNGYL